MRANLSLLLLLSTAVSALPQSATHAILDRDVAIALDARNAVPDADVSDLWKRKGGGGGGGRGGSGSSSGGRTSTGSGPPPAYGGRAGGSPVYGGGAAAPYNSGARTAGGISPFLIGGIGAAAIFPGLWLYSVYAYPYHQPWAYHNRTTNKNETKPVQCLCEQYQECGCEDNNDTTYQSAVIGDGSYENLNKSLVNVADVNGTSTILINGTLPNGTTAAGGTDDSDSAGISVTRGLMQASGYWMMIASVGCAVFLT